ncbi:MAG: glutamate-5-semialdehyde dehydrogenase [Spirochaetaceae bacterium]|jgi:glutamate-5-semialdehyde dehydrogenase|nr:glutamate-5-semialdehyde dehydrogenase [Spirochaetaceae bacterium]
MKTLLEQCKSLKISSINLSCSGTDVKNRSLLIIADYLKKFEKEILLANLIDIENARESGMKESLIDRLSLNPERIEDMIDGIKKVVSLKDPVWNSRDVWTLENGITVSRMSVPLGVISIIYESRPNVTIDAFTLALKSGNAILLRGSSSAINSNKALVKAVKEGLDAGPISSDIIELVEDTNRALVGELLNMTEYLDLVIPRGGAGLIKYVTENSKVPSIETGVGNCHIFVDESADFVKALNIIENAKIQRPGVCNSCETVLIHEKIAKDFLPLLVDRIGDRVEIRACELSRKICNLKEAVESDWETEFLDYILAVKIVNSNEEAIDHINRYGSKHSEAIITDNLTNTRTFQRRVDAAAVYVNASTRFTDGSALGFGAEMGISTQKIHARGPMGLNELVTIKYVMDGNGQTRE